MAGAAGVHHLAVPPPVLLGAVRRHPRPAASVAGHTRRGNTIVLADRDNEDWRQPGIDRILANASPPPPTGAVLLFHDGGGDRAQTVAAARALITTLQAEHYRFVTVSDLMGRLGRRSCQPPPPRDSAARADQATDGCPDDEKLKVATHSDRTPPFS